jgi:hypothetical protein
MPGLCGDGRALAVADPYDRLRRESEQSLLDGRDERGTVGERPAGAARAAVEERVAGEDGARRRDVQAGPAGGVAGTVRASQFGVGDRQARAVGEFDIGAAFEARLLPQREMVGGTGRCTGAVRQVGGAESM